MAKKSKKPLDILKNKQDKLDWHKFNFLENILVFCVCPEKSVPKESGVHFRITPRKNPDALCLLFKIDRGKDSLFEDGEIKPDYMVLYLRNNLWLFTIIELKGTTEKGLKHGIEQIKSLRDRLREEFRENLPNNFRVKFQAIILSPPDTQTPDKLIAKESLSGFVIKPLQYFQKAELFDYISQEIKLTTERYKHQEIKSSDEPLLTEYILSKGALPERLSDDFQTVNKSKATNKEGIYVNYALPETENYSALAMDNSGMIIAVKENEDNLIERIRGDLESLGLQHSRHFEIVDMSKE